MRLSLALLLALLVLVPSEAPGPRDQPLARWVVELEGPPLASQISASAGRPGLALLSNAGHLDVASIGSQYALSLLHRSQDRVAVALAGAVGARELRRFSIVLNAVVVAAPAGARERLLAVPGVRGVTAERPHSLTAGPDVDLPGVQAVWSQLGGPSRAGSGIKIAIIDSGINVGHPSFDPTGYAYPPGFPKGEAGFTTPKVIVARMYARPDDPPKPGEDTPVPVPTSTSHGTHVAAIAAGNAGVAATVDGSEVPVSGIAPGAYLMNYRIFYESSSPRDIVASSAFDVEIVAALEDAVVDGADVINNSWGGTTSVLSWADPIGRALEGAVAAGAVVVKSAGNSGSATATIAEQAGGVIAVGAVTAASEIARNTVEVTAPQPVPSVLKRFRFSRGAFGVPLESSSPEMPIAVLPVVGQGAACDPPPGGALAGSIALVARGGCTFVQKALNAQSAGALAVLFVNDSDSLVSPGSTGDAGRDVVIPVALISRSNGDRLKAWLLNHQTDARIRLDPRAVEMAIVPDVIAGFSSRGPGVDGWLGPDIVAPGVNIFSAGFGPGARPADGFGQASGTSMAAPFVSGSAALLRQIHPDWTPSQVRSALMTTAQTDVRDDRGFPVGALERGAGRIDLRRAVDPTYFADPPRVSFGAMTSNTLHEQTVRITGAVKRRQYRASVRMAAMDISGIAFDLAVLPESFSLGHGESATVVFRVRPQAGTPAGDYQGDVIIESEGESTHFPVWLRIVPERDRPILLIDNDGSADLGLNDTAGAYSETLAQLGIAYDVIDADVARSRNSYGVGLPNVAVLQRYRAIVLFTGTRDRPSAPGSAPALRDSDQAVLIDYLNGGGRMLVAGRRVAEATDVRTEYRDPLLGRSRMFHNYLGIATENFVAAPRTMMGSDGSPLAGRRIDILGDGELAALEAYPDRYGYSASATTRPILVGSGAVFGVTRSSEPSLEEPRQEYRFRAVLLAFGIEDVAEPGRADLLGRILAWLNDSPQVDLELTADAQDGSTILRATGGPAGPARYRWDFGDGAAFAETSEPTIRHRYATKGRYFPRVEVTDGLGHRVVAGVQH